MFERVTFFALVLLASGLLNASALTVEEAYRSIPHNRTMFDAQASTLSTPRINALKKLFDLSDRGIVLRVEGLRALQSGSNNEIQSVLTGYRALINNFSSLHAPPDIKPAMDLVFQSIQLHQHFFETKLRGIESGGKADLSFARDQNILEASQRLHAAYSTLMKNFPNEPVINRQAFYDSLCALDFL